MPKPKGDVNKSAEIRAILEKNPKTPTKDVVDSLAQRGIKISGNLVYLVKAKMGAKRRKVKRQHVMAAGRATGNNNPVELILKVRRLADEAGGIRSLKKLVDVLAE